MSATRPISPSRRLPLVAALAVAAASLVGPPASAQFASGNMVYTYDIAPGGTINNAANDTTACYAAGNAFTFSVPDSFTYNSVSLGLNITHPSRGQIRAFLAPPGAATPTLVFANVAAAFAGYDIMMSSTSDATAPALNDGTTDILTEPYYNRMVYNAVFAAAPFISGSAANTWTLYLCDRTTDGNNGTLNRARLVLSTTTTPTNVCTSSVFIDWGTNGGGLYTAGADYPPAGLAGGGVTMTREAFGSNPNGGTTVEANQKTVSTSTFGATLGYYQMRFTAPGSLAAREGTYYWARFRFNPPVRDLQWGSLDVDTGAWEDAVRIYGTDAVNLGGNRIPYALTIVDPANASFQFAGDFVEADSGNVADAADDGNSFALFKGTVASARTEYWALNEPTTLQTQRIGISDAQFCAFDYGDAPNTYGTQLAGGARHVLGTRTLYLGTNPPDGEADGAPGAAATTDDTTQIGGVDDEDGVASFPAYIADSTTYTVSVRAVNLSATTAGNLVGYIDWNRDGDFADANEISGTVNVPANTNTPTAFNVTWNAVPFNAGGRTATYARFRIAYVAAEAQSPTGQAASGEVEDYPIAEGTLPVTIARVESTVDGDLLTVRWTTASEWANAGFAVWGKAEKGSWTLLAEVPTANPDSLTPQHYETAVAAAGVDSLLIEDLSLFGERRSHGPYAVGTAAGDEPEGMTIDWAAVKAEAGLAPAAGGSRLRLSAMASSAAAKEGLLLIREEGIHRITHEELLAAGVDLSGLRPDRIAIIDNDTGVARHIVTTGDTFGAGSSIEFYARPQLTLASPVDVFVLTQDKKRAIATAALPAGSGAPGVTAAEDRHAPDRTYSFGSPNGDPWYDQGILAWSSPVSATRTFDLPDLAAGPVELTVKTWGYGAWPGSEPDHHVVLVLNGNTIADGRFDGITAFEPAVDVTSVARETGNVLEVRVAGDTGYRFDYVALDGFSVRYTRQTAARDGRFEGEVAGTGGYAITGFGDGETVAVWRLDRSNWKRGEQSATAGQVQLPAGGATWAAATSALLKPGVTAGVPAPRQLSKAQYVIVTHPSFAGAVADLVALEESRGFTTEVVTVDELYAAYSDHAASAQAVKRFLKSSWQKGNLKYVLLVGADTTDPYDHLGRGSVSFVPTEYLPFVTNIAFSPTDEALVDANGDSLGEVPIGRLPVRTPAELQEVVAKLRAWEANLGAAGRRALMVAGASDADSNLPPINRSYADAMGTWETSLAVVDEQGTATVRGAVLAAINGGTPLVSFVGHSSMGQWDNTPLLRWQDVTSLTNAGRPNLVVQWGCWNSYYVEPTIESLSAHLLRAPAVGSAAAIGATTLTSDASHQALGTLFFAQVNGGATTIGNAFRNAKKSLLAQTVAQDAILGMALLGDPAMSLPR